MFVSRRILTAKNDILESDFYCSLKATIREGLDILGNPELKEIISYGLGHFSNCMISRYQFALLLCLKDQFNIVTYLYDPLFYSIEKQILEEFDCTLIKQNEEGKRKVLSDVPTLLFFPHCPKQLTNNFLYTNWSPKNLRNCLIIGNSFNKIVETTPTRILSNEAQYILNIAPYVDELYMINTFKYTEIFNDTSLHIFQEDKLRLIDPDFWTNIEEPTYPEEDCEFITNQY